MDQLYIGIVVVIIVIGLIIWLQSFFRKRNSLKSIQDRFGTPAEFNFEHDVYESIKSYYAHVKDDSDVDDTTWNDLDMDKIYNRLNQSMSSIGDSFMYAHLRKQDNPDLDSITAISERLRQDLSFRTEVQKSFSHVGRVFDNGLEDQLYTGRTHVPKRLKTIQYQAIASLLPFVIIWFNPFLALMIFAFVFTINAMTYYSLNKELTARIRSLNFFVSILKCGRALEKNTDLKVNGLSAFSSIKSYLSIVNVSVNEAMGVGQLVVLVNAYFCLYAFSFLKIINAINKHSDDAIALYESLGMVEMAYSRASVMVDGSYCVPLFNQNEAPEVVGITHPLISEPIANSIALHKNMLVTGSNASGKSTFVRSVAVNVIIGQRLNFCFAESMAFRKCHVATSMAISDDVSSGDSYFIAEIKSIKRLLEAVETYDYSLLIIDEILKGTNTIERISASSSILDSLKNKPAFVCAATHDIELVQILGESYENVHFRERIDADGIRFDYKIQEGPSNTRNAIKLLEYYHYDDAIVSQANQLADAFSQTKKWKSLG